MLAGDILHCQMQRRAIVSRGPEFQCDHSNRLILVVDDPKTAELVTSDWAA